MTEFGLDRGALGVADLAYIEETGSPAAKVAAAIYAYEWALANTEEAAGMGTTYPSLADWREHRMQLEQP